MNVKQGKTSGDWPDKELHEKDWNTEGDPDEERRRAGSGGANSNANANALNKLSQGRKKQKINLLYILMGLSIVAIIGFSIALGIELYTDWKSRNMYTSMAAGIETHERNYSTLDLAELLSRPTPKTWDSEDDDPEGTGGAYRRPSGSLYDDAPDWEAYTDFNALGASYQGLLGWIENKGTIINYPVMQWRDNDYFLHHLPDGETHRSGAIFVDYRNNGDLTDKSTLIYGHALKSGDMFGSLKEYRTQSYYEEHPIVYLYTPTKDYAIVLFAGYLLDSGYETPPMEFKDEDEFMTHIADIKSRSVFKSNVTVYPSDQIVYLCTCAKDYTNARLIIVGKLIVIGSAEELQNTSYNVE